MVTESFVRVPAVDGTMVMNPDGTGQRAVYGTNTWFPNSLYFPRPVPGRKGMMVCILSGYHGVHRMGQLVLLDTTRGGKGVAPLVKRISGRGDRITLHFSTRVASAAQ